jgi:soluble lytic murein transglycosylase-like protein
MVMRLSLICAAAATLAGSAVAAPDWRAAGGEIFAAASAVETAGTDHAGPAFALPAAHQPYEKEVGKAARRHGIDPKLLHALVTVESSYRADAVSIAGAGGLTQLMPSTAGALGVADRFDASANLAGGADYLARQLARFGDLRLALAAYNAGPERVAKAGAIPKIPATRRYVDAVVECFLALSAGRTVRNARDCRGPQQ